MKRFKYFIAIVLLLFTLNSMCLASEQVKTAEYWHQQVAMQRYPWSMMGFCTACQNGEKYLAECYINGGFDVNQTCCLCTPLLLAVYRNQPKVVELLLQNGANPDLKCPDGTPLYMAIYKKHTKCVDILIKYNADVNLVCKNKTPLNFAIKKGDAKIVKSLLEAGAKPDEKTLKLVNKTKNQEIKQIFSVQK